MQSRPTETGVFVRPISPGNGIRMITRLWVMINFPNMRFYIGELTRLKDGFEFRYVKDADKIEGLRGLPEFPYDQGPFKRKDLFATFSSRLPSTCRPDYDSIMTRLGVEDPTDPFEILYKSKSATDNLVFAVRNKNE